MPKGKALRRPNGSGTIIKLSGNRRRPFEVRVNTHINEWGYPVYDVLGRFEKRIEADIALADYNRNPFDVKKRDLTFQEVYQMWFDWKYSSYFLRLFVIILCAVITLVLYFKRKKQRPRSNVRRCFLQISVNSTSPPVLFFRKTNAFPLFLLPLRPPLLFPSI